MMRMRMMRMTRMMRMMRMVRMVRMVRMMRMVVRMIKVVNSQCPGDKNDYATYHKRVPYVGNYEIIMIIMIRMILTTTDKNDDITS